MKGCTTLILGAEAELRASVPAGCRLFRVSLSVKVGEAEAAAGELFMFVEMADKHDDPHDHAAYEPLRAANPQLPAIEKRERVHLTGLHIGDENSDALTVRDRFCAELGDDLSALRVHYLDPPPPEPPSFAEQAAPLLDLFRDYMGAMGVPPPAPRARGKLVPLRPDETSDTEPPNAE